MNNIGWPGWQTVRQVGKGSFGTVYEIRRVIHGYEEKAALKVITIPQEESDIDARFGDGYTREEITERYRGFRDDVIEEYNLMASMKGCSNIVYSDDIRYEQHDDGMGWDIFIKMELLSALHRSIGQTISDAQVIKIGKDICNALVFCEREHIIHRDIKPQNIFVAPDGTYKLGDFGIAKTVERTTSGTKTGTYQYMAPEVYNNEEYGAKVDIYSLGLVLYWLLNERRMPFLPLPPRIPTVSEEEAARKKRFSGSPIPEPAHGSAYLKKIVLKACAHKPKDRYQNAEEMLQDLTDVGMGRKPSSFLPKQNPDKPNPGYSSPEDKPEDPLQGDDEGETEGPSRPHGSTGTDDVFGGGKETGTEGVFDGKDPTGTTKDPQNHWGRIVLITLCSIAILAVCFFIIHKWTSESEKTKIEAPVITSIELNSDCHPVLEWTPVDNAVTYYIVSADVIDQLSKIEHISKNYLEKTSATSATVDWSFNCNEFTRGGKDYRIQIGAELSNGKYIISSPETVFVPEHFHDNMHNLFRLSDDHKQLTISGEGRIYGSDVPSDIRNNLDSIVIKKGILPFGEGEDSNFFKSFLYLKSITLPEEIEKIPDNAFRDRKLLNEIRIPQSITYIGQGSFIGSGIKDVEITSNSIFIGNYAFKSCKNLENVSINCSGGTVTVCNSAFAECESLKSVSIKGLKKIEDNTFEQCVSLKSMNFENIISIGNYAFSGSGLSLVDFPDSLEEIGKYAFSQCRELLHVTIPSKVNEIKNFAFSDCESLQTVIISEGVKYVEDFAFTRDNLISVTLPKSLRYIGQGAFPILDDSLNIFFEGSESQWQQIAQDASYYRNVYYNTTYLYQ